MLKELCIARKLKPKPSKRGCAEALLIHLSYSKEKLEEILEKFKKPKAGEEEKDDQDGDDGMDWQQQGEDDGILAVDTMCEAKLLGRLLRKMERAEADKAAPTEAATPVASREVAPWPDAARGLEGDKPDVSQLRVPAGCRVALHTPLNASPFIQGFLPAGEKFRNVSSTSRAYKPSGSSDDAQGRATRAFSAAQAEVLEFLWSWKEAKDLRSQAPAAEVASGSAGPAHSAERAPKRARKR